MVNHRAILNAVPIVEAMTHTSGGDASRIDGSWKILRIHLSKVGDTAGQAGNRD